MKTLRVSLGIAFVFGTSLVFICLIRKPPPTPTALAVRFVGVTNDDSGRKLAIFDLSNPERLPIKLLLPCGIELRNTKYSLPAGYGTVTVLSGGKKPWTVKVRAPQTQDQWRVAFCYYPMVPRDRFNRIAAALGFRNLDYTCSLDYSTVFTSRDGLAVYSDWLNPTLELDWMDPIVRFDWPEH